MFQFVTRVESKSISTPLHQLHYVSIIGKQMNKYERTLKFKIKKKSLKIIALWNVI